MKKWYQLGIVMLLLLFLHDRLKAQGCNGCTTTISGTNNGNYTVGAGQTLCISASARFSGSIILNGGTVCNEGMLTPITFIINSGEFNNYGTIIKHGQLAVNGGKLNNFAGALIKVTGEIRVGSTASFLSDAIGSVIVYPMPALRIMPPNGTICNGNSIHLCAASADDYVWSPATSLNSSTGAYVIATPTTTTTYTLTGTTNSVTQSITVTVTVNNCPFITTASITDAYPGSISLTNSGGHAPFTYSWDGEEYPNREQLKLALDTIVLRDSINADSLMYLKLNSLDGSILSDLEAGKYHLSVKDSTGDSTVTNLAVKRNIDWFSIEGMSVSGTTITKTTPDGWDNTLVLSQNILNSGQSGGFEYGLASTSLLSAAGLRLFTNTISSGYSDIRYGFYVDQKNVFIIHNGNKYNDIISTYSVGDKLRVERDNGSINYYQNNVLLTSYTLLDNTEILHFTMDMYTAAGAAVGGMAQSGIFAPSVTSVITDLTCTGNNGSIDITIPTGSDCVFSWTGPGGFTASTEDIFNLTVPGIYKLQLGYKFFCFEFPPGSGNPVCPYVYKDYYFRVGYKAIWKDIGPFLTVNGNNISKGVNGGLGSFNSSANTENTLVSGQTGWAGFRFNHGSFFSYQCREAFAEEGSSGLLYGVGSKRVSFFSNKVLYYVIDGNAVKDIGLHVANDEFVVERLSNTIKYYKNFSLIGYTPSAPPNMTLDLMMRASLISPMTSILNTHTSFGCSSMINFPLVQRKLDGSCYLFSTNILFKYDEEYTDGDGNLQYNIYDSNQQVVLSNTNSSQMVNYGDNRYNIPMSAAGTIMPVGYYVLEVINEKNEKWYLRFKKTN